jgi:hypothetical protein
MCANVNASLGLDILIYAEIHECSQSKNLRIFLGKKINK